MREKSLVYAVGLRFGDDNEDVDISSASE